MPFTGEKSNKLAHSSIIRNPEIIESLSDYKILFNKVPPIETFQEFLKEYEVDRTTIRFVYTVDGGFEAIPIDDNFPSAQVGFVQFSQNLVNLEKQSDMVLDGFVDPFKFNQIFEAKTESIDLPIFNTASINDSTILETTRKKIASFFRETKTYREDGECLSSTLLGILSEEDLTKNIHCLNSTCRKSNNRFEFKKNDFLADNYVCTCPLCHEKVYLTDILRLNELVDEEFGSHGILSRLSRVVEQLLPINFIRNLLKDERMSYLNRLTALSSIAFVLDGPLAIYGEPAKINRPILNYLCDINLKLKQHNLPGLVYFGLQKTGKIVEHVDLLIKHLQEKNELIKTNSVMVVSDNYRYNFIEPKPYEDVSLFGKETYYGQDMIIFNQQGNPYVITSLYPQKRTDYGFSDNIFSIESYTRISETISLINELNVDMYNNALLPIVLAHKYASISLQPGVSTLTDFAQSFFNSEK